MVVGDGTLIVLTWLRGLVQMLVPMMIRLISNSGSTAMVAKISESHDDDNSGVLAEDKEYMKTISNRVPIRPSDCNRGMYVWPSTVGPKPKERRSKRSGGPETLQTTTGAWASGQVWKSQWAHVPGPQEFLRCVGESHVKCQLVDKAEPLPMCAS